MESHPVRLVLRDDLERSRLTVFFRLLLAIPHFVWFFLWTVIALLVALANWVAVLATGTSPAGLHRHLSGYIRYSVHLGAYLTLAANPYPPFNGPAGGYPVDVEIDPPVAQRRWTVLVRLFLALPALLLSTVLGSSTSTSTTTSTNVGLSFSGGLAATAAMLGWFASLVTGRMPLGLRNAAAWGIGYQAQTMAYALCLTDRYPYAGPEPGAPCSPFVAPAALGSQAPVAAPKPATVQLVLADDLRRSRLTVFFRILLAVPHFVWLALWSIAALLAWLVAWVAALATGRVPGSLHRFLSAFVRYGVHVQAFVLLVGSPFPGFTGAAGSYPVDVEIDPPVAQARWRVLLRGLLALPALLLAGATFNVATTSAVLMWFAGLATGRAPQGLRNAGAYGVRYSAETYAYLLLLTERYPYAGPEAGFAGVAVDEVGAGEPAAASSVPADDVTAAPGDAPAAPDDSPGGPSGPTEPWSV